MRKYRGFLYGFMANGLGKLSKRGVFVKMSLHLGGLFCNYLYLR